jgi:transcriptional regulator with XRE-family HTH domain
MSATERFWEEPGYGEIVAVSQTDTELTVHFANGDQVEVGVDALGADYDTEFTLGEDGALLATGQGGEREIDWMVVRRLADPAFAEELRERDAEEARRVGARLRVLRENAGISQKAASEMAGMAAPQLARLERGETDMRLSTMQSLLRALDASFADISGPEAPEVSAKELSKRARKSGAPAQVLDQIVESVDPRRLAAVLSRGFGWPREALLAGVPTMPPLDVSVAFKSRDPEKERSSPLLRLARTISEISAKASEAKFEGLPKNPETIRTEVVAEAGEVTLLALTRWAWSRGVIVLPMAGPGFAAAAWYVGHRPVIVQKVAPDLLAYWLFALAHEIGHLALEHVGEEGVVDLEAPGAENDDDQEVAANKFALELLIPDHARIFEEIRKRSGATVDEQRKNFKSRAQAVAQEAGLNVPVVAISAAYALSDVARPRDRWGSAMNIAKEEGEARSLVRAEFKARSDLSALDELDAALIKAVVLE